MQVANFYAPTSGGLRIAIDETGRGYRQAGHERVLIVPGRAAAVEETPSGQCITVRGLGLPGLGNYRILTRKQRVLRLLEARPPDILEVSDKTSLAWLARWSRRHGVPVVLFSHERLDAILRPRVPRWFPLRSAADAVNRRLSRLADEVVVTSAFSAAEFHRIGAPNVRRVPLGVDLDVFRPSPPGAGQARSPVSPRAAAHRGMVARPGPGERPVRLVTVTRLSREKRPETAIGAVRALVERGTPVALVVVGDGPDRERLRRRAAGLPVTFLGHVSDRRAVAALVAAADVALFPSPAETFGLATLEALACGTPVVVPDQGAARELLDGPGSGAVADGTPDGMADAVRALMAIPEQRRRACARAAAERFPWEHTVGALLRRYEEIGRAGGSRAR